MVTISQAQIDAFNANREREYPDITPTVVAFPLKKSLEGHSSPTHREFDLYTPDSMTTDSYRAAVESHSPRPRLDLQLQFRSAVSAVIPASRVG